MPEITPKTKSNLSESNNQNEMINDNGHLVTPANPFPKRHRFIRNGTFKSVQNGTEFIPATSGQESNIYTLDGWFLKQYGGCTVDVARRVAAYTDVPCMYHAIIDITSVDNSKSNLVIFEQREHDITKYAGRTLSLSFIAKASVSSTIFVELVSDYNNSDANSSDGVPVIITENFSRHDVRINVPPIPSADAGSLSKLVVRFWLASNMYEGTIGKINQSVNRFSFAQIEDGSRSSEPSTYDEIDDVCRYFEKNTSIVPVSNAGKSSFSSDLYGRIYFSVKKAIYPTPPNITISSNNIGSPLITYADRSGFAISGVASSSTSAAVVTGFTCNCELGE